MFGKFGKYHPDAVRIRPEPFDLVAALRADVEFARAEDPGAHAIEFQCSVSRLTVTTDREHWRYIVVNLLQNAFKYSPAGSTVAIGLEIVPGAARVRVRDRGIGVPEGELAELFSPFFRASNVGDRPGTGLGLAVVKESARLLGVDLAVDSHEGGGTTFIVTLPLAR